MPVRHLVRTAAAVVTLATGLTVAAFAVGGLDDRPSGTRTTAVLPAGRTALDRVSSEDLGKSVSALQAHLRAKPKDAAGWATLGAAYVEQARTTGDPTRYPRAQKALARSLSAQPRDNDPALAGRAALAAARHDFPGALRDADRALKVNAYSERALAVRVDALVELGRYDEAYTAARRADSLRPGIPVFTRLAYVLELRGDPGGARRVLLRARKSATAPGDVAYVATALGQLAWSQGQFPRARGHFADALRAEPGHLPALEGRGRTRAAVGDLDAAARDLEEVVRRYPLPAELAALGEVYEARGDRTRAREQYAVAATWIDLARANGVATDLDSALIAADHGDRTEALRAARAEWGRRHSVHTADALAWALHRAGRDREALTYAKSAAAPGYRNASFLYHRGVIEKSLGDTASARRHLTDALDLNPAFSLTGARAAKAALKGLGGTR